MPQVVHGSAGGRTGSYGRLVVDLDLGWQTERLHLEPLSVAHAAELGPLLDDVSLHEFTGGIPLTTTALAARYATLARRHSPSGNHLWGNWVMRRRSTGSAVGTVQATLPTGGPAAGPPRSPGSSSGLRRAGVMAKKPPAASQTAWVRPGGS